jgi:hypothetical protein
MNPTKETWSLGWRVFWVLAFLLACFTTVPAFVQSMRPERRLAPNQPKKLFMYDFFQEWASAQNHFGGLPVYTSQEKTAALYLNITRPDPPMVVKVNAHPPTSILVALPFAALDYADAFQVWNLMCLALLAGSLWLIIRVGEIPFTPWALFPLFILLTSTFCNPFQQHINQGQINLVLLPLVVGTWAADRSGKPVWAGLFLGLATALKLFPGLLFVYYLLRRQWKVVFCGGLSFLAVTGVTAAVLGVEAYQDYATRVVPEVSQFRDWWANLSLPGFWSKLFDGHSGHVFPLYPIPAVALAGTLLSCLAVLALWAWAVLRARTPNENDLTFGLTLTAMLLVSPITWDHYFVLLVLPIALLFKGTGERPAARWVLYGFLFVMCINPLHVWHFAMPGPGEFRGQKADSLAALTFLAYQCYTLIGFFIFQLVLFGKTSRSAQPRVPASGTQEPTALDRRLGLHPAAEGNGQEGQAQGLAAR